MYKEQIHRLHYTVISKIHFAEIITLSCLEGEAAK